MTRELMGDSVQVPDVLLGNSVKSTVTDSLNFDSLTNIPITINVSDLGDANVISDANQLKSLSTTISSAAQGAK
ncbi:hypothetical protein QUA81_29330 [Microcoleus sp. F6_B4]